VQLHCFDMLQALCVGGTEERVSSKGERKREGEKDRDLLCEHDISIKDCEKNIIPLPSNSIVRAVEATR
jgi:hypothetical protein